MWTSRGSVATLVSFNEPKLEHCKYEPRLNLCEIHPVTFGFLLRGHASILSLNYLATVPCIVAGYIWTSSDCTHWVQLSVGIPWYREYSYCTWRLFGVAQGSDSVELRWRGVNAMTGLLGVSPGYPGLNVARAFSWL